MLIPVTTTKIRTLRMTNPYSTVDLERCRVVVVPGWYGGWCVPVVGVPGGGRVGVCPVVVPGAVVNQYPK